MSDLSRWAKKNPGIAALLRQILVYVIVGGNAAERQALADKVAELDSDGDGVPDAEDSEPNNAAVSSRKARAKKAAG